ncbi:hypothetical protein A3A38_03445 [Candidatus Kaiserbacteria bacterium RIFCSPLOWO2_01_FULL_53_17]|uniref:HTH cro/C1-type domain-containing protein n=1 Tax=Candidatus Kaiserbacteria bacterium RIFCSPLOWO2_01_FULL_53_17 TaxID=1798511 RepID=A0A1F6EHN2_9BACT|nr:MAG: hypothetical protein A3A38_03445 [Candidatus Kaiserbacteria bacterium RIFCSPLOWO2_01_FULL_53_17]
MTKGPKPYVARRGTHTEIAAAMVAIYNAYWANRVSRQAIAEEISATWEDVVRWSHQISEPDLETATKITAWYKKRWPDWRDHGRKAA